jgi:hypothetical protein
MGNTYKGISDSKFDTAEKKLLKHSNIELDRFEISNVFIDKEGLDYIRTY